MALHGYDAALAHMAAVVGSQHAITDAGPEGDAGWVAEGKAQ